jgi:cell division protein FtsW
MATAATSRLKIRPSDKYVFWIVLILGVVGVWAVYSATLFLAQTRAGGHNELFLVRHVFRLVLAFVVMGVLSLVDYRKLARIAKLALLGSFGLLLLVQAVGTTSGGAARWLQFGSFGFQPSDIARVSLVLYVGTLLAAKQAYIKEFGRGFAPILVWILAAVVLIGLEDLSTAAVVLAAVGAMCFVGRVHVAQLAGVALLGLVLAYVMLLSSPHRAARIESYVGVRLFPNTESIDVFSAQEEGFQAHQARIAFAMGGLTGAGPGKSTQRDFLPAPYNDFIFAIIAEEYGLVGSMGLLALFVLLLAQGFLRIARHSPDPFGLFLAVGLTVMLVLYGFVHAGVASGLLPVTGLPLPFVSYGGTSMVANGAMVGILLNISRAVR